MNTGIRAMRDYCRTITRITFFVLLCHVLEPSSWRCPVVVSTDTTDYTLEAIQINDIIGEPSTPVLSFSNMPKVSLADFHASDLSNCGSIMLLRDVLDIDMKDSSFTVSEITFKMPRVPNLLLVL